MENTIKISPSDDDEDLEQLRRAALQTIKKKVSDIKAIASGGRTYNKLGFYRGQRKCFSNKLGRNRGNGQHNIRNANLISISTIEDLETSGQSNINAKLTTEDIPKLVLPQDRYSKSNSLIQKLESVTTKFDRYDNSNSESDEDEEDANAEQSDSLEAIMKELEEEIKGESCTKSKSNSPKTKTIVEENNVEAVINKCPRSPVPGDNDKKEQQQREQNDIKNKVVSCNRKSGSSSISTDSKVVLKDNFSYKPTLPPQATVSSFTKNDSQILTQNDLLNSSIQKRLFSLRNKSVLQSDSHFYDTTPNVSTNVNFLSQPPPNYVTGSPGSLSTSFFPFVSNMRQDMSSSYLPPISINTNSSLGIPLGPLSPRSAAFVFQNCAIVEKRKKKSPCRSYVRSPSPCRSRYSISPRRSLSPLRQSLSSSRRSASPSGRSRSPARKYFSSKRRSLSPLRRTPRSPTIGYKSYDKCFDKSSLLNHSKPSVRARLGSKDIEESGLKIDTELTSSEKDTALNSILEARKRKFEKNQINVTEGIIRLKREQDNNCISKAEMNCKEQTVEDETTTKLEECLKPIGDEIERTEQLELNPSTYPTFTDDETDNEMEDCFKVTKSEIDAGLPLPELTDEDSLYLKRKKNIKSEWKIEETKKHSRNILKKLSTGNSEEQCVENEEIVRKKIYKRQLIRSKKKKLLRNSIKNNKIEIKIMNPAKYEKNAVKKNLDDTNKIAKGETRKVELATTNKESDSDNEIETQIIVEHDDVRVDKASESTICDEGDLRTQLKRKRAERQHKHPSIEGVQSRLLQTALEDVVLKKLKSSRKTKHRIKDSIRKEYVGVNRIRNQDFFPRLNFTFTSETGIHFYGETRKGDLYRRCFSEAKVPVKLRLGLTQDKNIFYMAESKIRKKRKSHDFDQV